MTDLRKMMNRLLVSFASTRLSGYQTAHESNGSPSENVSSNQVRVGSRPTSLIIEQIIPESRNRLISDSLPGGDLNGDHCVLLKSTSLPTFDGNPSKTAEWLVAFELAAAVNLWRDADKILDLAQVLTKDTRKWFVIVYLPGILRGITYSRRKSTDHCPYNIAHYDFYMNILYVGINKSTLPIITAS